MAELKRRVRFRPDHVRNLVANLRRHPFGHLPEPTPILVHLLEPQRSHGTPHLRGAQPDERRKAGGNLRGGKVSCLRRRAG